MVNTTHLCRHGHSQLSVLNWFILYADRSCEDDCVVVKMMNLSLTLLYHYIIAEMDDRKGVKMTRNDKEFSVADQSSEVSRPWQFKRHCCNAAKISFM